MIQTDSTCPDSTCEFRDKFGYCTKKGHCVMVEAKVPIRIREINNMGGSLEYVYEKDGNLQRLEFIESYIKIGNADYQWNDNHGELIRCKDCKYYHVDGDDNHYCSRIDAGYSDAMYGWKPDDFCSRAEKS